MMAVRTLSSPVDSLEGVGPARAKALQEIGVATLGDLLEYFPRDYQFETEELPIAALREGQIGLARGEVVAVDYITGRGRPRFEATLNDGEAQLALVFFNGQYLRRQIHPGLNLRVRGPVQFFRGLPEMINPHWEVVEADAAKIGESKLRAVYPATAKLPSETIERLIAANLPAAVEQVAEFYQPALLQRRRLMPRAQAYRAIHQPRDLAEARAARRRIVYDELMLMQIGLALASRQRDGRISAPVLRFDKVLDQRIRQRFPFALTEAQQQCIWQILRDVASGKPMHRLLQGDVGSGKTVVALYAMLVAVANKMQAAILAPTEVLAEQHYLSLGRMLAGSNVNLELFTSRTRRQQKGEHLARLAQGQIHIAVGTQALLSKDIEFANLGLVVVDEQHRLGVRQRALLRGKAMSPHYLVMTATPIPRTLALSYFADFDVSVIDQLPPGRQPIATHWLKMRQEGRAYEVIRSQVELGRQAYIVLPQISDDGLDDGKSVLGEMDRLSKGPLAGLRLAALHGQLSTAEKQQAMTAFRDGQIDVLVCTTVIEVGIDVPNATVMMVHHADRFGLSQLHQLRGRVGRGTVASQCLLVADAEAESSAARLQAMVQTASGFDIAEADLRLRGPGQFFGTRQHGLPEFKLADISSELELLLQAKQDALALMAEDARLEQPPHDQLRAAVDAQFGQSLGLSRVG